MMKCLRVRNLNLRDVIVCILMVFGATDAIPSQDATLPSGYGQITGGIYYTNTYENLATFVTNKHINTILLVSTSTDPCTYCNYFRNYAKPGIGELCEKYGLGVHTWNNGQFMGKTINFSQLTKSFGMTGTTYPCVTLVPNPRNLQNNTNTWYAANIIRNFEHTWFSSTAKNSEFPAYLETVLQAYTNTIPYVDVKNVEEKISTDTTPTEITVLDLTTYITIFCPAFVSEGTNLTIRLRRSGSIESSLTVHVLESDLLVKSVTWQENDGEDKFVTYSVSQDDDFDDSRVLNFSVKSLYRQVLLK